MTRDEMKIRAEGIRSQNLGDEFPASHHGYRAKAEVSEARVETREGAGRVFLVRPKAGLKKTVPLYINIHGGGFVRQHTERDLLFCSMVAVELGCLVMDIDYKLAPEHPFPAPQQECYDLVKWAVGNALALGVDPTRVAVGGHSAGGNLAASVALMANVTKEFSLKLQIIDYACLDLASPPESKPRDEYSMPLETMRLYDQMCITREIDWFNPFLSPLRAPAAMLEGLTPALIITAGRDCLRVDGEKYARLLEQAGVPVQYAHFAKSRHGFVVRGLDEWEAGSRRYLDALRQAFYGEGGEV